MLTHGNGETRHRSQPTVEQRLARLERNVANLNEAVDQLYRMAREQQRSIGEYVTKKLVAAGNGDGHDAGVSPEDAMFTFVCRRKFDAVEKELARLRQVVAGSDSVRRAG